MAIRDSDYESGFTIPAPKGIYQAAGDTNIATDYAYRAENIRTERGLLASAYGVSFAMPSVGAPIGTLARFYRRNRPEDPEIFVAAAGGSLYTYTKGTEGWAQRGSGFQSDKWSYVTYETTKSGETVDVLLLSNAKDGMVVIYGDDLSVERKTLSIGSDYASVKFAALGRYAERIWGIGAPGYPDSIFYSKPYSPLDWTANTVTPEMGGGVINQPTWDGESFMAIVPFGGYLLAIKPTAIFEIRGTDPTSFTITQAYGTDARIIEKTICADGTRLFYLTEDGIGMYNGQMMGLLSRYALYETMAARAVCSAQVAAACVCSHVYYLALALQQGEEPVYDNNAIVEYDAERGTFMLRTGLNIEDLYALGGKVYCTQASPPYGILRLGDPDAKGYNGTPMRCLWETSWLDLGKTARKSDFTIRFTAEASEDDVPLTIEVENESRIKPKTVILSKARRDYRVRIQMKAKRVKLRLLFGNRVERFAIYGGVQVDFTVEQE